MSMTPDHYRKVGTGVAPASPAPFLTPRPEKRRPDSRGSEWNSNRQDKDREVNVQVLLRCRSVCQFTFPYCHACVVHWIRICIIQESQAVTVHYLSFSLSEFWLLIDGSFRSSVVSDIVQNFDLRIVIPQLTTSKLRLIGHWCFFLVLI